MMAVTVDTYTEPMVAQTDTDTEDTSDIDYDCACAVYRPYFSCSQLPYTTPSSSGRSSDDRFDTDSDKEDTHKEHVSSDGDDTLDTDVIISYAPGNMKKTVSVSKLLCDIGNQSNSDDDDDHSECELNLDCALWYVIYYILYFYHDMIYQTKKYYNVHTHIHT